MSESTLRIIVRTPSQIVVDERAESIRVPTQSGQVGLRPQGEPTVLAVEAGLVLLRTSSGGAVQRFIGTAGGLLHTTREQAILLTPLAVVGADIDSVSQQLDAFMATPSEEMDARRTLGRLETRIFLELHHSEVTLQANQRKP